MSCWPCIVTYQYSRANKMYFLFSVYYELTASTCFVHNFLIIRRHCINNNWYLACVLCRLASTRVGVELQLGLYGFEWEKLALSWEKVGKYAYCVKYLICFLSTWENISSARRASVPWRLFFSWGVTSNCVNVWKIHLTFWLRDASTSITFNNGTFCPRCIYVLCKQRLVPLTA
jgi:hypothetical protein